MDYLFALIVIAVGIALMAAGRSLTRRHFFRWVVADSCEPLSAMLGQSNISISKAENSARDLAFALTRCATCKSRDACVALLEDARPQEARTHCPNASLIEALQTTPDVAAAH